MSLDIYTILIYIMFLCLCVYFWFTEMMCCSGAHYFSCLLLSTVCSIRSMMLLRVHRVHAFITASFTFAPLVPLLMRIWVVSNSLYRKKWCNECTNMFFSQISAKIFLSTDTRHNIDIGSRYTFLIISPQILSVVANCLTMLHS